MQSIGLDIARSAFQVHGVGAQGGVVIRRQLKRRFFLSFFEKLAPCLVLLNIVADPADKGCQRLRGCASQQWAQLQRIREQILAFDRMIAAWHRSNEVTRRRSIRRDLVYAAGYATSATGTLYRSPRAIIAQTIRAILLASRTHGRTDQGCCKLEKSFCQLGAVHTWHSNRHYPDGHENLSATNFPRWKSKG